MPMSEDGGGGPVGREPSPESRLSPPFACRQRELQQLLASMRCAFAPDELSPADEEYLRELGGEVGGEPPAPRSLVVVGGSSGMGKSHLVQQVKTVAQGTGVRVKEVFCYERQGIPFLPILRVVKELLTESQEAASLWSQYSHVLARVYPELTAQLGGGVQAELPDDAGRIQLFDALTGLLCQLARARPLLLVVHDLHRSDVGTVDFLEYLSRNVFLENVSRRQRGAPEAVRSAEGDWKEIGYREGRRQYITEGLTELTTLEVDPPLPPPRLLVLANLLEIPARAPVEGAAATSAAGGNSESALVGALARTLREPFARGLTLSALSPEDMSVLLARSLGLPELSAETARRVHGVTGGNPLHALDLCRCLAEEAARAGMPLGELLAPEALGNAVEQLHAAAAAAPHGPASGAVAAVGPAVAETAEERWMRALVERRLAAAEPLQRELVQLLATLRRPAPVSRLVSFCEATEEAVVEALAALQQWGFVKVLPIQRAPRFYLAHEDYTRAVYQGLAEADRRALHERIGRILAAQESTSEPIRDYEVYEHLRASSVPRESVRAGLASARYFARGFALELATRIGADLVGLLSTPEDRARRAGLLHELSRWELQRGALGPAKVHAKELLEQGDALEVRLRFQSYCLLAEIYRVSQEPLKGIKVLNRVGRTCAEVLDERAQARVAALQARLRLDRKDTKRAIHLCMRGLQLVENLPEARPEQIDLFEVLAEAHVARAETGAALPHYQRLVELLEAEGDEVRLAALLVRLGRVYYDRGNYFRAARFLFKALDVFQRLGDVKSLTGAYDTLGKVYRNSGDAVRGLEYFNRCLRLRERIGDVVRLSSTLNSLGSLYAHAGEYYRAIRYFRRSRENAERNADTGGLVRAFLHLGWVYAHVGNLKQVESLAKQILILAQEFHLEAELESEGHRLQGSLLFQRGDWKRAERELRRAAEITARAGRKKSEAAALLDLGELLAEREEYEPALKVISRGQLLAEQLRSLPLRARALLLKGNVYRFLKGGNPERARECFHRGIELLAGENPLPLLWELEYALAKVHQEHLEFAEAGECYRRAERMLERIVSNLPEDMKVAFRDQRRRKLFFEDYRRFQKEAAGRAAPESSEVAPSPGEERVWSLPQRALDPVRAAELALDPLLVAVESILGAGSVDEWGRRFLEQARRLVPSPAGALIAIEPDGRLGLWARREVAQEPDWLASDRVPGILLEEARVSAQAIRSGAESWRERLEGLPHGHAYRNRSLLIVPFLRGGKLPALLYLQRPTAGSLYEESDVTFLERLFTAVAGSLSTLERLEMLTRLPGARILNSTGFTEQLRQRADQWLAGESSFCVARVEAPLVGPRLELDPAHGAELERRLREVGGEPLRAIGLLGGDQLVFLCDGAQPPPGLSAPRLQDVLGSLASPGTPVKVHVHHPEPAAGPAAEVARMLRLRLEQPDDFSLQGEIDQISSAGGLTLKEAKSTLERRYIAAELLKSRGNITKAAEQLGVHRPQLSNLIKKYNVRREDFE